MYSRIYKSFVLFFVAIATGIAQEAVDGFLVKPYLQYSTKTTIRILWETKELASSSVEYGEAIFNTNEAKLVKNKALKGERYMHEVELKNLKPETNYFWRVISETASGKKIVSNTYTFKTVVQDDTAFSFALIGDAQQNRKTPWAWDVISGKVWEERPSFVINAGDLVDWGPNKNEWVEEFLAPGHKLMSRIPMYAVLGNHEGDADYYYQYMANPAPEYWYTFTYGNADFFMIDSNRDISEGSDQYNWLEQQLAKSTATWKIAVHHHPPYSSEENDHGNTFKGELSELGNRKVRDLPKLYDKYGVDFSLYGHTHVYERTWPLKNNLINQREGTIYINSGGAGGGLEDFAPTRNWFAIELQRKHHYCTFAIYDKTLIFKAIDSDGHLFDTFQMNKEKDKDEVVVVQPPAPIINSEAFVFHKETAFTITSGLKDLDIYYTLDGSEPSQRSKKYQEPVPLKNDVTVKARTYSKKQKASRVVSKSFKKVKNPIKASRVKKTKRGLQYKIFEGDWRDNKSSFFDTAKVSEEGVLNMINIENITPKNEYWAIEINGYIEVPKTAVYTFYGLGTRGLDIKLDGKSIIDIAFESQKTAQLVLETGKHKIAIRSFQRNWRKSLGFGFYNESLGKRIPIKPFNLSH
jgi:predicted phosphodiesterase